MSNALRTMRRAHARTLGLPSNFFVDLGHASESNTEYRRELTRHAAYGGSRGHGGRLHPLHPVGRTSSGLSAVDNPRAPKGIIARIGSFFLRLIPAGMAGR